MLSQTTCRGKEVLVPDEKLILRLLEDRGKIAPLEFATKSPLGMRKTQAILGYLIRKEFVAEIGEDFERLCITQEGLAMITN
jgi:hypothetical protein